MRILHDQTWCGRWDVGAGSDGTLLTTNQLIQLVFEAAEELGIMNFRCRDCNNWAEWLIQWRPQNPFILLCENHLNRPDLEGFDVVRKLVK